MSQSQEKEQFIEQCINNTKSDFFTEDVFTCLRIIAKKIFVMFTIINALFSDSTILLSALYKKEAEIMKYIKKCSEKRDKFSPKKYTNVFGKVKYLKWAYETKHANTMLKIIRKMIKYILEQEDKQQISWPPEFKSAIYEMTQEDIIELFNEIEKDNLRKINALKIDIIGYYADEFLSLF